METTNASCKVKEDPAIKRLRARLNRWELEHLRQLASDLHEQLEWALSAASSAEHRADMWQSVAEQLQDAMAESGGTPATVGLTMHGDLVLMKGGAQAACSLACEASPMVITGITSGELKSD
jgi:Xaa-Pro aminopeptidase